MTKSTVFSIATLGLIVCLFTPVEAHAGYHIFVGCEKGLGVAPSGPNPNILCEYYWEDTGPNFVNKGDWSGTATYLANPAIKDEFISPQFFFNQTPQPLAKWIGCSDVAGSVQMIVYAKSYRRELRQGYYSLYDFITTSAQQDILATHPC